MKAANHFGLENLEYLHWLQKRNQWDEHNFIFNDTRKEMVQLEQQHKASQQLRKEGVRVQMRLVVREQTVDRAYLIYSMFSVNLGQT